MFLKNKNWFKINSFSSNYYEVKDHTEIIKYIKIAIESNLKIFILGEGSNVLLNEKLDEYLILKFINNSYSIKDNIIEIDAGYNFDKFIDITLKNNLIGLEHFSLIPGNIGGVTFMNIHYKNYFLSDYIKTIYVFQKSKMKYLKLDVNKINYSYTKNIFKDNDDYIIYKVEFELKINNSNYDPFIVRKNIIKIRKERYPEDNTCGCFFYNINKFEGQERSMGYQIEKLDIENKYNFNNVKLHSKHKNMFVTNNNCKSKEIIKLASFISREIFNKLSYKPKVECRLIGFPETITDDLL
jgi:UDP-N-acetylmuramate dehydrogenase